MIIGFGHRARRGKDTCAKMLKLALENRGWSVEIKSFGLPVKRIAFLQYDWAGIEDPLYYDQYPGEKERYLPALCKTVRQVFEEIGEAGTSIYRKTWVEPTLRNLHADVCICSDVRNYTEVDEILGRGGEVYRVDRDGLPNVKMVGNKESMDERLAKFAGWTGIVNNSGSLDDLSGIIDTLAERVVVRLERNRV